MLPFDVTTHGKLLSYLTFLAIGISFGTVLELAGFGDARKLAAQFYLKDMTVLKTMFTGILTACLLIFLSGSLGYLDFSQLFVNQTYLWPGIVGGLVMGVGFVVGGYCPGTSVVSAASLKLDGLLFFVGTVLGAGLFGETVSSFSGFWNSSYTERLLLSDWFGWSIGTTVVAVTVLALGFFYAAEKIEARMRDPEKRWSWKISSRPYVAAAATALVASLVVLGLGQPTPEKKWDKVGAQYAPLLENREVFIHPLEYVKTWNDAAIKLVTLDLRSKQDYEAFHLDSARSVSFEKLADKDFVFELDQLPPQGVVVLVSDDEQEAVRAWRRLKVQGVMNLYILENGLKEWKDVFATVGGPHLDFARPPAKILEAFPKDAFKTKIKLKTARKGGGLCG